jgi:hypothetical protein
LEAFLVAWYKRQKERIQKQEKQETTSGEDTDTPTPGRPAVRGVGS